MHLKRLKYVPLIKLLQIANVSYVKHKVFTIKRNVEYQFERKIKKK